MKIGRHDTDTKVVVVAEIGNNHEGDADLALKMIDLAARSGADAVKFQTFQTAEFIQRNHTERFAQLAGYELPPEVYPNLAERARGHGMAFLSTPFDLLSLEFLEPIVDGIKIASGDNDCLPLVEAAAKTQVPLIISTGIIGPADLDRTVAAAHASRQAVETPSLALLHCVSNYPVQQTDANLAAIAMLRDRYPGLTIGYSDHALGNEAAIAAVAVGARIVEKHFTHSRQASRFRDHTLAADPPGFADLVARIRRTEALLGAGSYHARPAEEAMRFSIRRGAYARWRLEAGRRIQLDDIRMLRPRDEGTLAPQDAIGRTTVLPVGEGDPLTLSNTTLQREAPVRSTPRSP